MAGNALDKASRTIITQCMGVKKSEKVLVVTDTNKLKIAYSVFNQAEKRAAESMVLVMEPRKVNGEEPPAVVAAAMKNADVVVMPTSKSLSHTKARKGATSAGARIASMPGITEDMMKRAMSADYKKIASRTKKLISVLEKTSWVTVKTKKGTDIRLYIKGRAFRCNDAGNLTKPGEWGNLPAGEACLAPVEGKTSGVFVVDASMGFGKISPEHPLKITVKGGIAVSIRGRDAHKLKAMFRGLPKKAFSIAELGIGTNDRARITGRVLEDEKVMGTAHIALGNNKSFGGNIDVPIHLDGVFKKPTIYCDNKMIIKEGKFLI